MELNRGSSSSSTHDGPRSSGDPAENSPPSPVSVIVSSTHTHSQNSPSPPTDDADSLHPDQSDGSNIKEDNTSQSQQHGQQDNDANSSSGDDDDDDRPILETLNNREKEEQEEQRNQKQGEKDAEKELPRQAVALTEASLTEQNKRMKKDEPDHPPNSIREWAATLPEIPDSAQQIPTGPSHIFEVHVQDEKEQRNSPSPKPDEPQIQETKDIFTDTQKIAYIGLCAVTSLEVVHDFQGKEFTYARMSADNWQRKLMRMLYAHMDISSEEIKMIESLSKHMIVPTDLVHQFTAQGETTTVNMGGFHEFRSGKQEQDSTTDKEEDHGRFVIDLRWTVMCDLLLLCLSAENYDARSRVFIARMASYLELDWFQVIGFEKRITEHLMANVDTAWETETVTSIATTQTTTTDMEVSVRNDAERKSRNKQRRKRRFVMIGLATIGGGLILGLSAGLMAPVIAGGLGTLLTTVGVTGTSGFLGGTAGIALITGGATGIGGTMGARSMNKRMKMISTFEFSPVSVDEHVNCIITISGWLPKGGDASLSALPFSVLDPMMGDHFTLFWEPEMLEALGGAFKIFATEAVAFSVQQALTHTIMGALLAGLAWPLALTKLGYLVDNPWNNGLDRAKLAGLILADSLMNRNLGARPVTLVGYSLGARVIFYCLLELARVNAFGLVENVALFGTPVSASKQQWKECTTVVSGRFINGYSRSDWLLGFLFRATTGGLGNVAGLRPLEHIEGDRVQNVECTDLVKGHLNYRTAMPKLLKRTGFMVTAEELPSRAKEEEEAAEKEAGLDLSQDLETFRPATMAKGSGSSVSSFSSGKASIQYPKQSSQASPSPLTNEVKPVQEPAPLKQKSETVDKQDPPPLQDTTRTTTSTDRVSSSRSHSLSSSSSSSSVPPITSEPNPPAVPTEPPQRRATTPEDDEIIAGIIANAAAVSKSTGTYSSLSSGRASIFPPPVNNNNHTQRPSSLEQSTSETTQQSDRAEQRRSTSSSSLFSKLKPRKQKADKDQQDLYDAGIEVKEIKSTLGRMVVPDDVVNPMPKITLEKPSFARTYR
ncbi:hypothetical protein BCR43DRAFT_497558 [Syncephalastrum racemosum]|uniref:DUF726-domain-containing protein n=1 Tax=Syncephalastrum racemosum TaxID=13706 RepID=A0A1X2H2F9_SYNRA|nr:hypothetical protein BCR43DRAFT_497558 [Syncephalastrum racemosum]